MGVGFPFLAYTLTLVQTPMIGVLMFESFHDIQYLTLVWAFNRGRVEKGAGAGSFLHFLFRKRAALVLLYVAMCLSFGSWDFVARSVIGDEAVLKVVLSFVSAMAFFHYYLDGFIWKLREPQTQQSLEVTAQPIEPWSPAARVRQLVTAKWVPQAAMWSILFLAPMGLLGAAQGRLSPASAIQSELSLAAAFGDNPAPQLELCKLFYTARDFPAASSHCQRALELSPGWFAASNNLAASLHRMGRPGEAVPFYRKALLRQPDDPEVRQNLALALQQLEDPAAQLHFEAAIALDPHGPKRSTSYYQLGRIHRRDDRLDLAEDHFRNAVRLDERRSAAHHSLAAVLALRGDLDEAVEHFERALELDPERAQVHLNLARLLLRLDRPDEAEAHFQRARRARARSQRTKPEDPRTEPDA
jgi:tetratricopeptide (TPR) repeat protein